MTFIEATKLATEGKHIRRPYWGYSCILTNHKIFIWMFSGNPYIPKIEDILADDWIIEEDKEEEE